MSKLAAAFATSHEPARIGAPGSSLQHVKLQVTQPKRKREDDDDAVDGLGNLSDGSGSGAENTTRKAPIRRAQDDRPERTLFVGNLSVATKEGEIRKIVNDTICKVLGKEIVPKPVESLRFRSLPVAGTAVPPGSSYKVMMKACAIQNKLEGEKGKAAKNAYLVLRESEYLEPALTLNGLELDGHHLRFDTVNGSAKLETQRAVFCGQLPFDLTDEELRDFFALKVDGGHSAIDSVRVVRDKGTQRGKGFGFVTFKDSGTVFEALTLNDTELKGRKIKVTKASKQSASAKGGNKAAKPSDKKRGGKRGQERFGEKSKFQGMRASTLDGALRRMKGKASQADINKQKQKAKKQRSQIRKAVKQHKKATGGAKKQKRG